MILDKKSSMEWTKYKQWISYCGQQKISFPFDRFLSIFLIIWSLDAASVSIYVNVLKWRPAAPSSEYLTHSLAAPAAPRIDLPKIEEHRGDPRTGGPGGPKIHFRRPRCERRGAEIHPGKLASWENKKNLERLRLVWLRWGSIYNILSVFSIMNKNI